MPSQPQSPLLTGINPPFQRTFSLPPDVHETRSLTRSHSCIDSSGPVWGDGDEASTVRRGPLAWTSPSRPVSSGPSPRGSVASAIMERQGSREREVVKRRKSSDNRNHTGIGTALRRRRSSGLNHFCRRSCGLSSLSSSSASTMEEAEICNVTGLSVVSRGFSQATGAGCLSSDREVRAGSGVVGGMTSRWSSWSAVDRDLSKDGEEVWNESRKDRARSCALTSDRDPNTADYDPLSVRGERRPTETFYKSRMTPSGSPTPVLSQFTTPVASSSNLTYISQPSLADYTFPPRTATPSGVPADVVPPPGSARVGSQHRHAMYIIDRDTERPTGSLIIASDIPLGRSPLRQEVIRWSLKSAASESKGGAGRSRKAEVAAASAVSGVSNTPALAKSYERVWRVNAPSSIPLPEYRFPDPSIPISSDNTAAYVFPALPSSSCSSSTVYESLITPHSVPAASIFIRTPTTRSEGALTTDERLAAASRSSPYRTQASSSSPTHLPAAAKCLLEKTTQKKEAPATSSGCPSVTTKGQHLAFMDSAGFSKTATALTGGHLDEGTMKTFTMDRFFKSTGKENRGEEMCNPEKGTHRKRSSSMGGLRKD